jgi:hypothetical protein
MHSTGVPLRFKTPPEHMNEVFTVAQQPKSRPGRLTVQVSTSHAIRLTHKSAGFLRTSQRPLPTQQTNKHKTGTSMPSAGFSFFVLCTSSLLLLCPHCPSFAFRPLPYNTHNTNSHAPGGIRTRNPGKRSATDPRLRPLRP